MTKKKYNRFLDIATVLIILFPLIMLLFTARANGTFDVTNVADYVNQYAISNALATRIGECINTFGIAFDGNFFAPSCVILANALLVWLFRVFVSVMTFIPKFALKMTNLSIGEKD